MRWRWRANGSEFTHSYELGLANIELGIAQAGLENDPEARATMRAALTDLQQSLGEDAPETRRAAAWLTHLGG